MNKEPLRPFVPVWLDDYGLTPAQFRILFTLSRHANNGVAWPSINRMIAITGMSKATIRRAIDALEKENLVKKTGKPFGSSCRYKLFPIVSPEIPLNDSNSATREPIGETTIVSPEIDNSITRDPSIVSPEGQEGKLFKGN